MPRLARRTQAPAPPPAAWGALCLLVGALLCGALPQGLLQGGVARAQEADGDAGVEPAVVSIEVTQQNADWYSPWQGSRPEISVGSGFLIGPGRIMTNAHVVSDARQIIVRRNGDNQPFFAEVEFIAHDGDLATLHVDDPDFAKGVAPLKLGGLPSLRSRVRTYGFPAGGEKISRTEGVVSRVQFITYLHPGADSHLAVQTDSAINPGNSGGPVVQEGKVIGVAFQTNTRLNDVGFFIPAPVIERFLGDIADGRYDGYGDLGVVTSNLINPTYRRYLGLQGNRLGVVVDKVMPGSSADGLIRRDDVITAIDDVPVLADSTIDYYRYSLSYQQVVEQKQVGEMVKVTLWRDGKSRDIRFPLRRYPEADRMRNQFDERAPYFIYAGLVFMALDREYLQTFGNYWENADKHLLYEHFYAFMESDEPFAGAVVIGRILPHRLNSPYAAMVNSQVQSLNGVPIHTLRDLEVGLRASKDGYDRFELQPGDVVLVLDKAEAGRAQPEILKAYGIAKDRYLP
jgi:S1-C subfamily serine protease